MQSTNDPKMLKWWGQYVESSGDMDGALVIYQKADDWYSQVKSSRVLQYSIQILKRLLHLHIRLRYFAISGRFLKLT